MLFCDELCCREVMKSRDVAGYDDDEAVGGDSVSYYDDMGSDNDAKVVINYCDLCDDIFCCDWC